jgi:hypothetical protein
VGAMLPAARTARVLLLEADAADGGVLPGFVAAGPPPGGGDDPGRHHSQAVEAADSSLAAPE